MKYKGVLLACILISMFFSFLNLFLAFNLYKNVTSITAYGPAEQATITFTVESSDTGGGTGGSGSGGGGGGSSGSGVSSKGFTLSMNEINLFATPGEITTQDVIIKNIGSKNMTFKISLSGINELAALNTNQVTLAPGEEFKLVLIVSPDVLGVYAGKIIISSESETKEIFVILNLHSEDVLFDVSLNLPQKYKTIFPGESIKVFINLLQIGPSEGVDVNAHYFVKDFDGELVLSESESFFVERSKSYTKEFDTSSLLPGDYVLGVEISYPGGFASSSAKFNIQKGLDMKYIYTFAALTIIALAVVIASILKYKKGKKHR